MTGYNYEVFVLAVNKTKLFQEEYEDRATFYKSATERPSIVQKTACKKRTFDLMKVAAKSSRKKWQRILNERSTRYNANISARSEQARLRLIICCSSRIMPVE